MYAAIATRPDIAYAVQTLSQFTTNPCLLHYSSVKKVLRYLKFTADYALEYGGHDWTIEFVAFSDADWGSNPVDRKSISGYCFLLGGGAISWSSKKQGVTALSSTEAEYIPQNTSFGSDLYSLHLVFPNPNHHSFMPITNPRLPSLTTRNTTPELNISTFSTTSSERRWKKRKSSLPIALPTK